MKRIFAIIAALGLLLSLCGCGTTSDSGVYANQDDFLKDMAKGIQKRLSVDDDTDTSNFSDEDVAAFYEKLAGYELNYIEKYSDQTFADATFNELAHEYINACRMQLFGARQFRNFELYDALWSGGSTVRWAIIVELYERYNLPITADEVSLYKPDSSDNDDSASLSLSMDGTLDIGTGLTFYRNEMIEYDTIKIKSNSSQILYKDNEITITLKSLEKSNNDYYINLNIENKGAIDRISCFCSSGYLDDYKITLYGPWGYDWAEQGKRADTYGNVSADDVKESGISKPKVLYTSLYVISTDGETGQYIAEVPLEIDWSLFK